MTPDPNSNPQLEAIKARFEPGWGNHLFIGPGWHTLIINLDHALNAIYPEYTLYQVKEKFGSLRYYIGSVPTHLYEEIQRRITFAELLASGTCEECGDTATAKLRSGSWLKTLCDTHANGRAPLSEEEENAITPTQL